jgi:hypothetical protein
MFLERGEGLKGIKSAFALDIDRSAVLLRTAEFLKTPLFI